MAIQSVEACETIHPKRLLSEDTNLKLYRSENLKCCITKMLYTHVAQPEIKNQ
jgi:hypothetical protein